MDNDKQILEMFREKGMRIEFGAQFSAKGQIAQLLDVVKPLLKERDEALSKLAAMESQLKMADQHLDCYRAVYGSVPADKPALRITEQDAREIAMSILIEPDAELKTTYIDGWIGAEGRTLLNKLNADREKVPAVEAPDGWKLVPIEATKEMLSAGALYDDSYRDMLEAAPSHSQQSVSTDHAGRPMTYWGGLADRCPSHESEQP